jgi:ectoine hydroxylase-related dioxygenase (phytanoyl-CoA dioxygenase family)
MTENAMAATARLNAQATADEVAAALGRDGYAVVEQLLTREEAAAKRAELTRILTETPIGRNDFEGFKTRRIYALFAKTRAFDEPATHPLVLGVLDRVLGPSYQLSAPVGIEISPGETAQVLHTDDGIYPIARPHQELVLNTMWALDDFTEQNGATRVVPGSHVWVDRRPDASTPVELATMPAGSVMFFVSSVFHGGGANNSDRPRLGTILEYVVGWLRPQENHILAVPRETARTLPQRLQELLGYNIHPPFVGYVDGRHPRRVLGG